LSLRSNPGLKLANAFGVSANAFGVSANAFGVSANAFGVSANAFGVSANAFGVSLQSFNPICVCDTIGRTGHASPVDFRCFRNVGVTKSNSSCCTSVRSETMRVGTV
jgi:hypothetical protein